MSRNRNVILIIAALAAFVACGAQAQQHGEYGDAPEGVLAYPATGVIGAFPTCITVGPATWIYHAPAPAMFFGPMKDFEPDGNAGTCPMFAPYDMDECFMDPDAGMIIPGAFTIMGGVVVPCGPPVAPLGLFCTPGMWGGNVDIMVNNLGQDEAFVNVLMDWNQDGIWAPSVQTFCTSPEHILIDFPIPPGFVGPLSALGPPPFLIGGDPGYVWSRFSITEMPVGTPWGGAGQFADGESEDYLVLIDGPIANEASSWGTIKEMYR
jgi:hypothetical protein